MFENNIQYMVTGYIILIVLFRALFQISPIDILFFTAIPANNGASIVATEFTTIGMIEFHKTIRKLSKDFISVVTADKELVC